MRHLAIVQFRHGSGCSLGQPYGECGSYCQNETVEEIATLPDNPPKPRYPTVRSALTAYDGPVQGWNLRCALCGSYGASYYQLNRPYWDQRLDKFIKRRSAHCPDCWTTIEKVAGYLDFITQRHFDEPPRSEVEAEQKALEKERRAERKAKEAHEKEQRQAARAARRQQQEAKQEALPSRGIFEQSSADREPREGPRTTL